jgi:hypothetical protein
MVAFVLNRRGNIGGLPDLDWRVGLLRRLSKAPCLFDPDVIEFLVLAQLKSRGPATTARRCTAVTTARAFGTGRGLTRSIVARIKKGGRDTTTDVKNRRRVHGEKESGGKER